jgi:hypothetical protein
MRTMDQEGQGRDLVGHDVVIDSGTYMCAGVERVGRHLAIIILGEPLGVEAHN